MKGGSSSLLIALALMFFSGWAASNGHSAVATLLAYAGGIIIGVRNAEGLRALCR